MKKSNTIEINGQIYDARTGKLLTSAEPKAAQAKTAPASSPHVARHPARHATHAPAAPRTLMRHVVKKPGSSLKRQGRAHGEVAALTPQPEVPINSIGRLDEKRLHRAKQVPRSRLIKHFSLSNTAEASAEPPISLPSLPKPTDQADHKADKSAERPAHAAKSANFLDQAIERSTSHLQPPPPKPRHSRLKRRASMAAAAGVSVIVLALIVSQNVSSVRLQMASAKAGFDVSLPGYRPAGYDLGQINYSSGVAAAQFRSPSGSHYTVTQKKSSWDSQALLNNFVGADYASYQTVAANGLVIYLYGNQNATWVKNGVWYVVQSNGSLNNQQLIDLAISLS